MRSGTFTKQSLVNLASTIWILSAAALIYSALNSLDDLEEIEKMKSTVTHIAKPNPASHGHHADTPQLNWTDEQLRLWLGTKPYADTGATIDTEMYVAGWNAAKAASAGETHE